MEKAVFGPCVSDQLFFTQLVNTDLPGMEGIKDAIAAEDYADCRHIFAERVRTYLRPDLFDKLPGSGMESITGNNDSLLEEAEKICNNELSSCGLSYQFGKNIDWTFNASPDGYVEWTWQLNRHYHWSTLAAAYRQTGDEKYAKCFVEQFTGWVRQAVAPDRDAVCYGNETLCWRSLETGLRLSGSFPAALHAFYKSEAMTDDVLVDFYKSIWEHAKRLEKFHSRFNWYIMELNGLGHASILYPELKESPQWYDSVVENLKKALEEDVYADGFQSELSTVYQYIVVSNYMEVMKAAEIYGKKMPQELYDGVERMLEVFVKTAKPDMQLPDIGDGHNMPLSKVVGSFAADFPDNPDIQWAANEGKKGKCPDFTSVALPYSGFMIMRTGWGADDLYACFDGGPFGACHQHQDKLNLVVYANGHFVIPEGGTYAYDTSPMRRYIISTRSHNTARVNGMDQNRQRFVIGKPEDMKQDSGMKTWISDEMDYAVSIYHEGYSNEYTETAFQSAITVDGRLRDKDGNLLPGPDYVPELYMGAVHRRGVMMIKKPQKGLKPFLLVFDEFQSDDINDYEILWHVDSKSLYLTDTTASTDDFTVMTVARDKNEGGLDVVRGAWAPECQGWRANTMTQGAYYPVWTVKHLLHGKSMKTVTLLYAAAGGECPVSSLKMEGDKAVIYLDNGDCLHYQEPQI